MTTVVVGWLVVLVVAVAAAGALSRVVMARRQRSRSVTSEKPASSDGRLLELIAPDLFDIDLRTPRGKHTISRWDDRDVPDDHLLTALRSMADARVLAALDAAAGGEQVGLIDDVVVDPGGAATPRHFDVTIHDLGAGRAAALALDVTDHHESVDTIIYQALHDPVTGLPNRAQLEDHVVASLARNQPVITTTMVIEVDRFDEVNKSLGHSQGDRFLHEVGRQLVTAAPEGSCLARIGNGRFGLAVELPTIDDAQRVAETIIESLGQPISVAGVPVLPGGSIGVACGPGDGTSAVVLLQRAEAALHDRRAPSAPVQFYDAAMDRRTLAELDLSGQMRRALDEYEFAVHYQPTMDAVTREILGAEALVRWNHPDRGVLGPGHFLDVVQSVGLGQELTAQVLAIALDDCQRWHDAGWHLDISVNVTAKDLQHVDATDRIMGAIESAGTNPAKVILEVTEQQLLEDADQVFHTFSALAERGIRCSIDDFGTGFSSISHLRLLPADELKIDRSFVSRMTESSADRIIVRNLINLAHELGHRVVAEGVEDERTAQELSRLGCDRLQGYFFHHPMSARQLERVLAQGNPGDDQITAI